MNQKAKRYADFYNGTTDGSRSPYSFSRAFVHTFGLGLFSDGSCNGGLLFAAAVAHKAQMLYRELFKQPGYFGYYST